MNNSMNNRMENNVNINVNNSMNNRMENSTENNVNSNINNRMENNVNSNVNSSMNNNMENNVNSNVNNSMENSTENNVNSSMNNSMNNNMNNKMKLIDCFGEICPIPIIKIETELKSIDVGDSFMMVVDHSCTIEAIRDKYMDKKHLIKIEEVMNGVWEITITKQQ